MTLIYKHFRGATSAMMWMEEARKLNGPMQSFHHDISRDLPRSNAGRTMLLNGDETYVEKAQGIVNTLSVQIDTPRSEWYREVYGYYPDIPSYLAGQPQAMWMEHKVTADHAPIRLWVGLTSSAMIEENRLIERGAALAAFCIAMANVRPVVLTPFWTLGSVKRRGDRDYYYDRRGARRQNKNGDPNDGVRNMIISYDISTQPLILSEILSIARPEVTRYVGIEMCRHLFGQDASEDSSFAHDSFDERKMREHMNIPDTDLYLPPIYGSDPLLDNPVKWIQDNIARFTEGGETDMTIKPEIF